ncbi:LysR family transcriptional regulator [Parahaliea aestuarii]|uniref:LysR family transcriptional regulator n=1 Tax=Parahaliea aestuarii TaxID=1852021 RepID=A0A5C8ZSP9_9GAMM|nr:LysR family transcriptional regulator [Parahaliea aestuarii]TXS91486.1 LysR family transcriptional regulator [Parahaliea aestuarii]
MDTRPLQKIDLNLLIALEALLEERSVSRAAQRLHITQPAMSKTLSRLRSVFGDALFTRNSRGIQPTPRALELEQALPALLADISRLVSGNAFDPWATTGEVVLALSEYVGVALLPPLIRRLHEQAPRLSIRTITRVENQLEQLAGGNLDFAIHISQSHYPPEFRVYEVGSSPPAILVREDHPLTHGDITWERLATYPLIRLYISDLGQAELVRNSETFNRMRNPQQGSLETSHLMTALEVLRNTDYFLPGPAYMLQNEAAARGIVALPTPEGADHSMKYMLVMHERGANSPLHQWMWRQMVETLQSLEAPE